MTRQSHILAVLYCIGLASGSIAETKAGDPSCDLLELAYDDGSDEDSFGGFFESPYAQIVQYFEPRTYPYVLPSACFCLRRLEAATQMSFNLLVLDDDGPDDSPGTVILRNPVTVTVTGTSECESVMVEIEDAPIIESGGVYIGLDWNPLVEVGFRLGEDQSNGFPPMKYVSDNEAGTWRDYHDYSPLTRALMIRTGGEIPCDQTIEGEFNFGSPTWNRIQSNSTDLNCGAPFTDAATNGQRYYALPIISESGGLLVAELTSASTLSDTVLALYCDPFEPTIPGANLISFDDQDGVGSQAGFYQPDNLLLAANTRYWLVVSTFNLEGGRFSLCLANGWKRDYSYDENLVTVSLDEFAPRATLPMANVSNGVITCSAGPSGDFANSPYGVIRFVSNTDEPIEIEAISSTAPSAAPDSFFSLYCGFSPLLPNNNLSQSADSGGLTVFQALFKPGALYVPSGETRYLVVGAKDDDSNLGDYTIAFRSDVTLLPLSPVCGEGSVLGQRPKSIFEFPDAPISDDNQGALLFDLLLGLDTPATHITWWGARRNSGTDCTPDANSFNIRLSMEDGGFTGIIDDTMTVSPTVTDTGFTFGINLNKVYQYEADLPRAIPPGLWWLGIAAADDIDCTFGWYTATVGDGVCVATDGAFGNGAIASGDRSFCLSGGIFTHTTDQDGDYVISLTELLRLIQFFNSGGLSCATPPDSTEDGYQPGSGDESCAPHNADYAEQDWAIGLSELLRVIQFFNSGGYQACPGEGTEDGFCPGIA